MPNYPPRIPRVCEVCSTPFAVVPSELAKYSCRFCSRACHVAFQRRPFEVKFWEHVEKTKSCWLWRGCLDVYGYGICHRGKHPYKAHRESWIMHYGAIPDGLWVLHNCPEGDQKQCVNPAHLFLGTTTDNMRDASRKGQLATGDRSGARLHPETRARGSRHGEAKLTEEQVREIKRLYASGDGTTVSLARIYGISQVRCSQIVRGKGWRHVDADVPGHQAPRLTRAQWQEVLAQHHHRCYYCGATTPLTKDHVIPRSKGGLDTADNIVPACSACNASKGNRSDWPARAPRR